MCGEGGVFHAHGHLSSIPSQWMKFHQSSHLFSLSFAPWNDDLTSGPPFSDRTLLLRVSCQCVVFSLLEDRGKEGERIDSWYCWLDVNVFSVSHADFRKIVSGVMVEYYTASMWGFVVAFVLWWCVSPSALFVSTGVMFRSSGRFLAIVSVESHII